MLDPITSTCETERVLKCLKLTGDCEKLIPIFMDDFEGFKTSTEGELKMWLK